MVQGLNLIILISYILVFYIKKPYKNINLINMQLLALIFVTLSLASFFFMAVNQQILTHG